MKWMACMLGLLAALGTGAARAAVKAEPYGVVTFVGGEASVASAGDKQFRALKLGSPLFVGDRIRTGSNGKANFSLSDGTQVKLNYNTDIALKMNEKDGVKNTRGINALKLFIGDLWSKIAKNPKTPFEFETSSAVAAVKGSSGEINGDANQTCILWAEGTVDVSNDQGSSGITNNQTLCVKFGVKPPAATTWTPPANGWFTEQGAGQPNAIKIHLKAADGSGQGDLIVPIGATK